MLITTNTIFMLNKLYQLFPLARSNLIAASISWLLVRFRFSGFKFGRVTTSRYGTNEFPFCILSGKGAGRIRYETGAVLSKSL